MFVGDKKHELCHFRGDFLGEVFIPGIGILQSIMKPCRCQDGFVVNAESQ